MIRTRLLFAIFAVLTLLPTARSSTLDPRIQMTQYGHRVWRVQDGALPGEPTDIAQTKDGYLWIATKNGLARFDGVTFKSWHDLTGKYPGLPALTALGVAADGTLWVGSIRGLYTLARGGWRLDQRLGGRINGITRDSQGDLWTVRSRLGSDTRGPLCKLTPALVCYTEKDGVKFPYGTTLSIDPSGTPWMGSSLGISAGLGKEAHAYTLPRLARSEGLAGISAILANGASDAWVGIDQPPFGLFHLQNDVWNRLPIAGVNGSDVSVSTVYKQSHGALLIGTFSDGLFRIDGPSIEHYDHGSGLSGDTVENIFEDATHNLWVVTQDGLDEFYQPRVVRLTRSNGIGHGSATTINQRANGDIWVGDHDRFDIIPAAGTHAIRSVPIASGQVTAAFVDGADHLWAGVGHDFVRIDGDTPHIVQREVGVITDIKEDGDQNLWIRTAPPDGKIYELNPSGSWSLRALPVKDPEILPIGTQVRFFKPGTQNLYSGDGSTQKLAAGVAAKISVPMGSSTGGTYGTWLSTRQGDRSLSKLD